MSLRGGQNHRMKRKNSVVSVRQRGSRSRNAAHLIFLTDYGSKSARRKREGHVVRYGHGGGEGGVRASAVVRRPAFLVKEATLARSLLDAAAFRARACRPPRRLRINERYVHSPYLILAAIRLCPSHPTVILVFKVLYVLFKLIRKYLVLTITAHTIIYSYQKILTR